MLSRISRAGPVATRCTRHLITQPTIITQGDHCAPIFLNPPSQGDADFGEALRMKCEEKKVDLEYVDLRMYQIKHENYEFDAPALPRENSGCWAYLWGNRYVKNQVLLETLKDEDDYLRGYLTDITNEYSRKMRVHFPKVDCQGRKKALLESQKKNPEGFAKLYLEAKLDALSDYVQADTDGYLNLYKNNSYISSFDDGDSFGYDVPLEMETKIAGLAKFEWDQTVSNPDVNPYVQIISQLTDSVGPKLKTMNPKLAATVSGYVKSAMTCSDADLAAVVDMVKTTSGSLCGSCPDDTKSQVSAVLAAMKGSSSEQIVKAFRGRDSPSEAASLKGKSDADMVVQFADTCETRLAGLVCAANASANINDGNVAAVLVSGLFNNCPMLFNQFVLDENNVQSFCSTNGSAFDNVAQAVSNVSGASAAIAKDLDAASKGLEGFLATTLSLDKATVSRALSASLPDIVKSSGTAANYWMSKVAAKAASDATGLDMVECQTFANMFANPEAACQPGMKVYDAFFTPGSGSYCGATLRGVSEGCAVGTFTDNVAAAVAQNMLASGLANPAQAEVIASKAGNVPEMKAMSMNASKAQAKYAAIDDAFMGVTWCVEKQSIPSLMMAYKNLPHPSFSNVNSY